MTGSYGTTVNPSSFFYDSSNLASLYSFSDNITFGTVGSATTYGMAMRGGSSLTTTLSGNITGASNITLRLDTSSSGDASSIWSLTGNNSGFNGSIFLNRGRLFLNGTNAAGTGSITLSTNSNAAGNLVFTNTANLANAIIVSTSGDAISTNGNAVTLSGVISGGGGLTKVGAGTLTVTGADTYTTGTNIQNGTLLASGAANRLTTTGVLTLGDAANDSGVLALDGISQTLGGIAASGTGTGNAVVGNSTTPSTFVLNPVSGNSYTFAGTLGGSGTYNNNFVFSKTGNGTVTLSGTDTYTGGTTISGGVLAVSNAAALSSGTVTFTGNGSLSDTIATASPASATPNVTNNILINSGVTATLVGDGSFNSRFSGVISGTGILNTSTPVTLLNTTNTYSGGTTVTGSYLSPAADGSLGAVPATFSAANITLNAGNISTYNSTGASFTLNLNANRGVYLAGNGGFDTNVGAITVNGIISGVAASMLSKSGSGTLTLNGANTYAGGTSLGAGAITLGNAAGLGTGTLTFTANSTLNNAGFTVANNIAINSGIVATINANSGFFTNKYTGTISGAGTLQTSNYALLTGTNTYSGGTIINGYLVGINSDAALGAVPSTVAAANITFNGGTLSDYTGTYKPVTLNANRGITLAGNGTIDSSGGAANAFIINGPITGAGSLTVTNSGSGLVVLNGTSSYSGGTNVTTGTLQANGASTALGSGPVNISGTGVLAGTGNTGTGLVTLNSGGAITGGTSNTSSGTAGYLTVGGAMNLSGGVYDVKLKVASATPAAAGTGGSSTSATSPVNDQLIISGLLSATSGATITPVPLSTSVTPGSTYSFVIADATGPSNSATAFSSLISAGKLALSSTTDSAGDVFSLATTTDTSGGQDLILNDTTAAPEPTSILLVGVTVSPLMLGRRRRRSGNTLAQ